MIPDANGYEPKERDIPVLLDSLQELFQEYGDQVTPTELAEADGKETPQAHLSICCRLSLHDAGFCFQSQEPLHGQRVLHCSQSQIISRKTSPILQN